MRRFGVRIPAGSQESPRATHVGFLLSWTSLAAQADKWGHESRKPSFAHRAKGLSQVPRTMRWDAWATTKDWLWRKNPWDFHFKFRSFSEYDSVAHYTAVNDMVLSALGKRFEMGFRRCQEQCGGMLSDDTKKLVLERWIPRWMSSEESSRDFKIPSRTALR